MPGDYAVLNRELPEPTCGGLALPFPPTQGRLMLPRGSANLREVTMAASPTCGTVQNFPNEGLWTQGVSDCVVVAIMQWDGPNRRWTKFCFHHMLGGAMIYTLPDFARIAPTPAACWAVFADKSGPPTTLVDALAQWGVPRQQISTYRNPRDFTFGLRFHGGYFGEVKFPYG